MKKLVACFGIALAASFAVAEVYPESGDRVVIGDMTYVLVRAGDWHCMTSGVAKCMLAYDKMNSTEEGRVAIHGRRGHTTITNGTITVRYADGFERTESVARNASTNVVRRPRSKSAPPPSVARRVDTLPSRLAEIMARRKRASSTTNEVTVTVEGGR